MPATSSLGERANGIGGTRIAHQRKGRIDMAVYKRGGTYWFAFVFDGRRIQRSTKQGNRKAAIDCEAAYRTKLGKDDFGIAPFKRERQITPEPP